MIFKSEVKLPGFIETDRCQADVVIHSRYSVVARAPIDITISAERVAGGVVFSWLSGLLGYEIFGGHTINISSAKQTIPELRRLPLYGFALATILQQHGNLVFHASSVEIAGKAVVVLGGKTHGKSTLITSLVAQGHNLLADDVTACRLDTDNIMVLPGVPCIKLWPDAMKALGLDVYKYARLYPDTTKRNYCINEKMFCQSAQVLDTVLILEYGEKLELHDLRGVNKMLCLSNGCYFSRYPNALSSEEKKAIFNSCASTAEKTRVVRIVRPRSLAVLDETCQLIRGYVTGD